MLLICFPVACRPHLPNLSLNSVTEGYVQRFERDVGGRPHLSTGSPKWMQNPRITSLYDSSMLPTPPPESLQAQTINYHDE